MKKKILSAILITCLLLTCFTSCGKKDEKEFYDYDYDLSEYIKTGEYKGLEYEKKEFRIEQGSTAGISYEGIHAGEKFEGGSGKVNLLIGSGQFIPGFEDGLVGYTVGDHVTLDLNFPEPYENAPELAGEPVRFEVDIISINGYEKEEEKIKEDLWAKYVESCEVIKYPEKELKGTMDRQYEYYESYAKANNVELDDFIKKQGMTEKEFDKYIKQYAEANIKQDMALFAISRKENIEPSEDALEKAKKDLFNVYSVKTDKEFKKKTKVDIDDDNVQAALKMTATIETVLDFIYDNAKIIESTQE